MSSLLPHRIPRPSAALVVALIALFTALGGTGYAALKITGANVANHSLTGLDVKKGSLGPKTLRPNSIGGTRIVESSLATVPSAQHAATADSATKATTADKAADADKLDGIDSAQLMRVKPRLGEAVYPSKSNFGNNTTLGTLYGLRGGQYLVTSKFTYKNGGLTQAETCTLHLPGPDDATTFAPIGAETVMLQKVVSVSYLWSASVSCTADPGDDDMIGPMSIIALRLD